MRGAPVLHGRLAGVDFATACRTERLPGPVRAEPAWTRDPVEVTCRGCRAAFARYPGLARAMRGEPAWVDAEPMAAAERRPEAEVDAEIAEMERILEEARERADWRHELERERWGAMVGGSHGH